MQQKRPRGRPKGTEINDGRYLDQVADLMLKEPKLKKTPAIARIVAKHFPEHQHSKMERRLLRKWNKTGDDRMNAACERRSEERRERTSYRDADHIGGAYANLVRASSVLEDFQRRATVFEDIVNPPALRWLEEQNRTAQKMQDMLDPPFMRRWREQEEMMQRIMRGF